MKIIIFSTKTNSKKMKKDFCDMSQPYGTPFEKFQLVNAMLPGKYMPSFKENIFFKIAKNISKKLYSSGIPEMDYEQFLAKKPSKKEAEFSMHQDLGYWPKTKNTWTATFSLALSDAEIINGCLHVIPGSNNEKKLREHKPKSYSETEKESNEKRDDSHTLVIESNPNDELVYLPVKRGDITIHDYPHDVTPAATCPIPCEIPKALNIAEVTVGDPSPKDFILKTRMEASGEGRSMLMGPRVRHRGTTFIKGSDHRFNSK